MATLTGPQGQYTQTKNTPSTSSKATGLSQKYTPGSQEWIDAMYESSKDDYLSDLSKSLSQRGIYNSAYSAAEEASALDSLRREIELAGAEAAVDESRYQDTLAQEERNFQANREENQKNRDTAKKQQNLAIAGSVAAPFLTNFVQTSGFNPLSYLYDKSGLGSLFSSGSSAANAGTAATSLGNGYGDLSSILGGNNLLGGGAGALGSASTSGLGAATSGTSPTLNFDSTGTLGQYYTPPSATGASFGNKFTSNLGENFGLGNLGNMLGQTALGGGLGMLLGDSAKNSFLTSGLGTLGGSLLGAIPGLGALGSLGGYIAPALKKIIGF